MLALVPEHAVKRGGGGSCYRNRYYRQQSLTRERQSHWMLL